MQIYEVCSQLPEFKTGGDEPNDINDILLMMICEIKLKFAGLVWFTKHQFLIVISQEYNHNRLFYNPEISAWEYILQNGRWIQFCFTNGSLPVARENFVKDQTV